MPRHRKADARDSVSRSRELGNQARNEQQKALFLSEVARLRGNMKASELIRDSAELIRKVKRFVSDRIKSGNAGAPPDWHRLQRNAQHAGLAFLQTEISTGLTFARIALKASDSKKVARNAQNARTAYKKAMEYFPGLPANTPGLAQLREQVATLEGLLTRLGEKVERH